MKFASTFGPPETARDLDLHSCEPTRKQLKTPIDRLHEYAIPEPMSGCWLWIGALNAYGYGAFSWPVRYQTCIVEPAHRAMFRLYKGPIPKDLQIDHRCDNRCCVNPDHLRAVTPRENTLRSGAASALNARKLTCPHGHALPESKGGRRRCRHCENGRRVEQRAVASRAALQSIVGAIALTMSGCAIAPTMQQAARITEVAAVASLACDGGTSSQFLTETYYSERNPFLPASPSPGLVWGYLAGVAAATITANRFLSPKVALVVNSILLATEVWSIEHNMAVGTSMCGIDRGGPWGSAAVTPENSFSTNTGSR